MNSKKKILIFAVSELYSYRKSIYNGNDAICGYTQLEAIPKFLIEEEKISFDEIIMLETGKTTEEVKNIEEIWKLLCDSLIKEEQVFSSTDEIESAWLDCFTDRIKSAVNILKFRINYSVYRNSDKTPNYTDIFINDHRNFDDTMVAVNKIVAKIRELRDSFGEENIELYMDIHGGPREIQLVLQAIISLLNMDNILIHKAYTAQANEVSLVDDDLQIFDFVSGMNEFINYGRASSLVKYYKRKSNELPRIINVIKNISQDISVCDMDFFNNHLDELKVAIDDYKNNTEKKADIELEMFISNIEHDYGELIDPNARTVLKEIEWCVKKGFIQQAITLMESKMPEEMFKHSIINDLFSQNWPLKRLYYKMVKNKKEWCRQYAATLDTETLEDVIKKSDKPGWKTDRNYIFEEIAYSCLIDSYSGNKSYYDLDNSNHNNSFKPNEFGEDRLFADIVNSDVKVKYRSYDKDSNNSQYPFFNLAYVRDITDFLGNEELDKKIKLIRLHMILKNERNKTNHAISGVPRASYDFLVGALEYYIGLVKGLEKSN